MTRLTDTQLQQNIILEAHSVAYNMLTHKDLFDIMKRTARLSGIEPLISGLSHQCSTAEPQPSDHHQPSRCSICTALVGSCLVVAQLWSTDSTAEVNRVSWFWCAIISPEPYNLWTWDLYRWIQQKLTFMCKSIVIFPLDTKLWPHEISHVY